MPIKVFSAPGDHRNDFQTIEDQVNAWISEARPRVLEIQTTVTPMTKRELGDFFMTLVVLYEEQSR